ncbi:hypothetical protein GCM10023175_20960 [Pseudonocardia xishanensis]|uniref:Uncharacterized protein n=1 Tax=Pseudonocardia xishanensis TaxID=630995 RepID=A0ABP8RNQ2_9PSEU
MALRVAAPDVLTWRAAAAGRWDEWLTAQDRGKRELHVTVQNKVTPEAARGLLRDLEGRPEETTRVVALALWRYDGGPWIPVRTHPYSGVAPEVGAGVPVDTGDTGSAGAIAAATPITAVNPTTAAATDAPTTTTGRRARRG